MAVSKMSRSTQAEIGGGLDETFFDFGEPEVVPVEISPGKFLYLKEPCADDLIEISRISEDKKLTEVEITLQIICILHSPDGGQRKLSLKEAKRLRPKQLKALGGAISELLGMGEGFGEVDGAE